MAEQPAVRRREPFCEEALVPIRQNSRHPLTISPPPLSGQTLNVPQIGQEQRNWCWAACADMVTHFFGDAAARQCQFANWLFGLTSCCNSSSAQCDRPCAVGDVVRVFSQWLIRSTYRGGTVPFSMLQGELNAGRPVEVGYAWTGGGGHVAIVRGWDQNATGPFLLVNDPAYGSGGVYYSNLLTAYGLGKWEWTWTGIQR